MLGSVVYNVVTLAVLVILVFAYLRTHPSRVQRAMVSCYFLGVTGWLYYQILSTTYGLLGLAAVPPLVHEINRAGEAMMVGSSILVFWAYGELPCGPRTDASSAGPRRSRLSEAEPFSRSSFWIIFWGCMTRRWPRVSEKPAKGSAGSFKWGWATRSICPLRST